MLQLRREVPGVAGRVLPGLTQSAGGGWWGPKEGSWQWGCEG